MDIGGGKVKKIAVLMMTFLLVLPVAADVNKGKRYYMKNFKQKFKLSGLEFVQLHTQAEWEALFADDAHGFIAEFSQKYPKHAKYLSNPKLSEKLQDLGDFAVTYASDSGKIPSCGDETVSPVDLEAKESSSANYF